jgi:hypothetical protein
MSTRHLHLTDHDELPAPRVDLDTASVLEEAIESLSRLRTPYWLGDAGVRLHALASLLAQAQQLLPDVVRDARDQELTWTDISQLLAIHPATAARRYQQPTK